ncbi:glycosyltransferase [Hymenobacter sp. BT188]|uniref:glycosyltransferase n=1 Tax=Hymenobacter sp. BT188 TaxID=2763504 RepID=UPI0016511DF0|nr:glycosyltransferase [Hymenobacter sp. BT188]MBC6607151.1 glycosyltransferase [Hymenobacter sp. BT188]
MTTTPLVSIGVASFNNSPYIRETLDSIRALDYPQVELIIIDDLSTDDSVSVIEKWLLEHTDFNARLIRHTQNQGVCRVCNRFIEESRGKYLCLIGSDDNYLPDKLTVQVMMLEAAPPDVGVVFSDVSKIDSAGNIIVPSVYATGQISPSSGDVWLSMLRTNFIGAMTTLVRRSCFEVVGPYDESLAYEDWDMWIRLARKFHFIYQPQVTAHYRIHGSSAMFRRRAQIAETNLRIVSKHLGVSAEGDAIIHEHIAAFSEQLYLLGGENRVYWLQQRWRQKRDLRGLALLTLARMGVSAQHVARTYDLIKRVRGTETIAG